MVLLKSTYYEKLRQYTSIEHHDGVLGTRVTGTQIMILVYVIAWVALKFGINTTIVVLEMGQISRSRVKLPISNTTRVVFVPNLHCYTHAIPSYTILADFVGVSMYAMYKLRY